MILKLTSDEDNSFHGDLRIEINKMIIQNGCVLNFNKG